MHTKVDDNAKKQNMVNEDMLAKVEGNAEKTKHSQWEYARQSR